MRKILSNSLGDMGIGIIFIIISIILIGIFLGRGIVIYPSVNLLLIVIGFVIFVATLVNTDLGLFAIIFSMLLSPEFAVGAITERAVIFRLEDLLLILVTFTWLVKVVIKTEVLFFKKTPLHRPILFYAFICIISSLLGIIRGDITFKRSILYIIKYFEYFLLFFMVVNYISTMKQAKRFIFFILLICFFVSLYAWRQMPIVGRLTAPFEEEGAEPNTFGGYLLLMMSLTLGLILYSESLKKRLALLALLCLFAMIFIFTLSRGSWVSFLPMIMTFLILAKRFRIQIIFVLIIMAMLFPRLYALERFTKVHSRVKETFTPYKTYKLFGKDVQLDESTTSRIETWTVGFEMWTKQPLFGYGVPVSGVVDNQYMRVLTETGIIGFFVFLWIIFKLFKIGWHAYSVTRDDKFSQGLSLGFLAGLAGLLVHCFSAATFIIIRIMEPFWFIAAIVFSLPEIQSADKELQADKESQYSE